MEKISKEMEAMWTTMRSIEMELPAAGLLVPHDFVVPPSEDLRSRQCTLSHVDTLTTSILQVGLKSDCRLQAVVVDNHLRELFTQGRLTVQSLLQRLQDGHCKLQIIVGDHRQRAIKAASRIATRNLTLKNIPISKVFVLPKYSPFMNVVRMYGDADNRIAQLQRPTTTHDLIDLMRKSYNELITGDNPLDTRSAAAAVRSEWKTMLAGTGRGSRSNVTMYADIALRPKAQYELLYKIMAGGIVTTTGKKTNPVRQAAWFTQGIPNMNDDVITSFLQEVADGEASTKDFTQNCRKYRSKVLVEDRIIEVINTESKVPFAQFSHTIGDIRNKFPRYDIEFGESFWSQVAEPGWVWKAGQVAVEITDACALEVVAKAKVVVHSAQAKTQPVSPLFYFICSDGLSYFLALHCFTPPNLDYFSSFRLLQMINSSLMMV